MWMAEQLGEAVTRATALKDFNDEVRNVAILMCHELHVSPDDVISCDPNDINRFTPYEWERSQYWDDNPLVKFSCARWELFRRQAALALAGWRAVHKHALMAT